MEGRSIGARVAFYVGILVFVLLTLFPILWILRMSVATTEDLFATPPKVFVSPDTSGQCGSGSGGLTEFLPFSFKCPASYETVFADEAFKNGLRNSLIIAGVTTILCLGIGSVGAYALARIEFFARRPVLSMVLAISFFPAVAIIAPLFVQFETLGLLNTYGAAIIPDVLFALPLTVYLLVAYFRELPADIEEAAKVDGATTWQAFWKVTVPLSAPGVVTTGLLTFIFAWNEFLFANTFLFDDTTQPATVVIPQFATIYTTDYGAQAAASLVMTLPLVVLVLFFQRRIVSGLTAGATTG
jgi:ABC-type glycerol-3-phosphate transport system permease component